MLLCADYLVQPVLFWCELVELWKVEAGKKMKTLHVIAEHEHFPESASCG
jgi:hypothetical protein